MLQDLLFWTVFEIFSLLLIFSGPIYYKQP